MFMATALGLIDCVLHALRRIKTHGREAAYRSPRARYSASEVWPLGIDNNAGPSRRSPPFPASNAIELTPIAQLPKSTSKPPSQFVNCALQDCPVQPVQGDAFADSTPMAFMQTAEKVEVSGAANSCRIRRSHFDAK